MLREKVAIVTGANRGIGLAIVKVFAQNGARIWACARKESQEFEEYLGELASSYNTVITPLYFDVTDQEKVKKAVCRIGQESKKIDILVNNAGISVVRLFSMTSIDIIKNVLDTNFLSQISLSQMVSRHMIKNKLGVIINIASVTGLNPKEGGIAYGSSKAAVLFSTKTMALELGKYGIRVNSVSPGFIDTDMWKNRNENLKKKMLEETPLQRQGTPEEVANTVLFLASDLSSYITGQNIIVDGGRNMVGS